MHQEMIFVESGVGEVEVGVVPLHGHSEWQGGVGSHEEQGRQQMPHSRIRGVTDEPVEERWKGEPQVEVAEK